MTTLFIGVVKKATGSLFKIVHEKHRAKDVDKDGEGGSMAWEQRQQMTEITTAHPELKPFLTKAQEVLTPIKCYELMQRISPEDMVLLWMDSEMENSPETLIQWNIPVPPVPIRPSVPMDSGTIP